MSKSEVGQQQEVHAIWMLRVWALPSMDAQRTIHCQPLAQASMSFAANPGLD